MRDLFGTELEVGMYVVFTDYNEDDIPRLALYRLTQVIPGEVIGEVASGDCFYLDNPETRAMVVGDARDVYNHAECYEESTIN